MNNIRYKSLIKIAIVAFFLYMAIYFMPQGMTFLKNFYDASRAIILALVLAFILNILLKQFEKIYFPNSTNKYIIKTRRSVSILASLLTIFLAIFILIRLIVPQLYEAIAIVVSEVPKSVEKLVNFLKNNEGLEKLIPENIRLMLESTDWKQLLKNTFDMFFSGVGSALTSVFDVAHIIINKSITFVLGLVLSIYILADKENLIYQSHRLINNYIPKKKANKIKRVLTILNETFTAFVGGQLIEAVILGVLCIGGMLIFRFPYATMIGTLVGCTSIIPVAGSFIGAIVGAFMILTISPMKAFLFIIFIIVLQQIESNLIYPRVVGNSIGLPGLLVLASITVAGSLFGIVGMLVSVPLTATIYRLVKSDLKDREDFAIRGGKREEDLWKI